MLLAFTVIGLFIISFGNNFDSDNAKTEIEKILENYRTSRIWFEEKNNSDSALFYAEKGFKLANSIKNDSLFHILRMQYVSIKIDDETTEGVYNWISEAIIYQEEHKIPSNLAITYNILGNYHFVRHELDLSLEAYQKSIDNEEKAGNEVGMAISKFNIGFLLQRMGRYDEAYSNIRYGYDFMHAKNDSSRMLRAKLGLADLFAKESASINPLYNLDSSIYYARDGFNLAHSLNFKYGEMRALRSLSKALYQKNECEETIQIIQLLQTDFNTFFDEEDFMDLDQREAEALLCLQKPKDALRILLNLDKKEYNSHDITRLIAEAYSDLGELKLSLKYLNRYIEIHDSVTIATNKMNLAELQTKYETEKKDSEIATLSQQAQIQELKINQRNTQLLGAGIILLLAAIGGMFFYQQRKLKHQQAVSDMEQRMLRLQMNPHFIFNALTSIQTYILQSNTKESVTYLGKFAKLMRQILEHSRAEFVTISEESDMLKNYLQIQQLRFKGRFDFEIEIDESIDPVHTSIPPLFAQPFVENAIEHGMKSLETGGMIFIRFKAESNNILLEIQDNGSGFEVSAIAEKNHKSLATIISQERLQILSRQHHQHFDLSIISKSETAGVLVSIRLPLFFAK